MTILIIVAASVGLRWMVGLISKLLRHPELLLLGLATAKIDDCIEFVYR